MKFKLNTLKEEFFEYATLLLVMLLVNLVTSPDYLWVVWPALSFAIALIFSAFEGVTGSK